jgi:hypothetical protein
MAGGFLRDYFTFPQEIGCVASIIGFCDIRDCCSYPFANRLLTNLRGIANI